MSIYDKLAIANLVAPFLEGFAGEFFILVCLLIVLVPLVLRVCHCVDISVVKILAERRQGSVNYNDIVATVIDNFLDSFE